MRRLDDIVHELGLLDEQATYYGRQKAKLSFEWLRWNSQPGKLILVTGMTPTPHGEGKTVVSIGLAMALERLGRRAIACIRQPSLGPVFGIKGGGAGGGKATLEPMQDVNLRLTGDFDAVAAAHNLLAAVTENHIFHGNELRIDPNAVVWPRALDVEDRSLRQVMVGIGGNGGTGHPSRFVITAASEIMAILCLSRDYADLKQRLGRVVVAYTRDGEPVRAGQLEVVGAMAALMRDALQPNLIQTCEGTPALVHGGPFGNIAHGTCSLLSIRMALELGEYAVVEAGFGSDLGAEKFVDIVAPAGGLRIDAAVIVATTRALKYHGDAEGANTSAVEAGLGNLSKHIENVRLYGIRPIVAINRFARDTPEEIQAISDFCRSEGVPLSVSSAYLDGGGGSRDLAELAVEEAEKGSNSRPLYGPSLTISEKVETVVTRVYGGAGVKFSETAGADVSRVAAMGHSADPVCIAKTANSLSDDPTLRGRPTGFVAAVRGVEASAGAGFNVVKMGEIMLMPGLPKSPASSRIRLSDEGVVSGVS